MKEILWQPDTLRTVVAMALLTAFMGVAVWRGHNGDLVALYVGFMASLAGVHFAGPRA